MYRESESALSLSLSLSLSLYLSLSLSLDNKTLSLRPQTEQDIRTYSEGPSTQVVPFCRMDAIQSQFCHYGTSWFHFDNGVTKQIIIVSSWHQLVLFRQPGHIYIQ
jgi:hypothetical protein